ncbi:MAG TPA: RNA 2',3'-cyclic phosphodiesterase [Gaiellaceae bacterium]|jgi:2'-5' RNA ligase|nr:RNA 2',3'-cyclic phosphodiesterase [Gaiellaceae bacterium]
MTSPASLGDRERLRLFVAFLLPETAVRALVRWQRDQLGAPEGARIVPEGNLHVTVAFLGSRPAGELQPIAGALRAAAEDAAPPVLTAARYRETRSVGMLVCDDEQGRASRIAEDVHRRLQQLGVYQPEKRPWLPHLTVVRFRDRPRLRPPIPDLGPLTMSGSAVMHSVLRPSGAQYEVLESVPLGGG